MFGLVLFPPVPQRSYDFETKCKRKSLELLKKFVKFNQKLNTDSSGVVLIWDDLRQSVRFWQINKECCLFLRYIIYYVCVENIVKVWMLMFNIVFQAHKTRKFFDKLPASEGGGYVLKKVAGKDGRWVLTNFLIYIPFNLPSLHASIYGLGHQWWKCKMTMEVKWP